MVHLLQLTLALMLASTALVADEQEQYDYCAQDEYYEQSESCQQAPSSSCCKKKRGHRWGDDPYWRNDRFGEEQFQDTGWPGRRGDELSDQLSR